jgi:molybdopterin-containing oxidoreductase family membrane subunit
MTESYATPHAETHTAAHHHAREPRPSGAQAVRDFADRAFGVPGVLVLVFGVLALLGAIALVLQILSGPEPYSKWGYTAAVLAFLFSTAHSAPMIGFATRLAKGFWAVPIRRAAELYFTAGLITTPLFLILLFQLPSFQGRRSIWNDWPGSPHIYDGLLVIAFSLTGWALLYFTTRPDMAVARDRGRRGAFTGWGRGWFGTPKQWSVLTTGLILLGAFYVALYAYVHIFMVADMAMSLVPGWKSAIYPAYHGVSGIQAGFATTLLTIAALRKWGGLRGYIQLAQFWGLAKLLLALSLLFFYFSWDEFVTYWYGRTPEEMILIHLLMFGPYIWLYLPGFFMNFVLPFLLLIWNPIRVSIGGPPRVAAIVLLGNFIDRIRIYVASWSVAGPVDVHLDRATLPGFQLPTILDLLIVVGAISGVLLLYLLALRRFPVISLWEYKQADLLTVEKPYVKGHVAVIAKPN